MHWRSKFAFKSISFRGAKGLLCLFPNHSRDSDIEELPSRVTAGTGSTELFLLRNGRFRILILIDWLATFVCPNCPFPALAESMLALSQPHLHRRFLVH
jgi:hypothetical protein